MVHMLKMTKEAYLEDLEKDLLNDKMFITERTDLVDKEITSNCWVLSFPEELVDKVSSFEILEVLIKVKANRQGQLESSGVAVDLIYYLWFDEQAGQIRFNFINSFHKGLPFGCKLDFVETEKEIIDDFLHSPYLNGIPMGELKNVDPNEEKYKVEEGLPFTLKVYKEIIRKRNTCTNPKK